VETSDQCKQNAKYGGDGIMFSTSVIAAAGTSNLLQEVLNLVSKFAVIGGGLWLVWGAIVLAGGLKDKNGPALQAGIWQVVGGGLIIGAAALFANIAT